ncbi:MAG: CDP-alcohol phosphatidyltransferase family protein [Candidatus Omnitrophica bacterium]|nr:CDP-alcohol phosphatidyltransferase family protein [Candidatus Omnitrophota bacterium]
MESAHYMANVSTAANILFGAMSILLSVMGKYIPAAWIIFFSIVFDIADGKIARMGTKGFSEFGKQFDSLADLVSFVVAPSVLVFTYHTPEFFLWRLLVCLLAIFCGAFRLARYNTEAEDKIALFFNGLPTPAFGGFVAANILVFYRYELVIEPRFVSITIAILAMLMVSRIQYPTYKDVSLLQWKYIFGFAIIFILLFFVPELVALVLLSTYIIYIPIRANIKRGKK